MRIEEAHDDTALDSEDAKRVPNAALQPDRALQLA
jgi:hypothetical protein